MEHAELSRCARCKEDASMVELDGKYFARVRRATKCKRYFNRRSNTCQTELCDTVELAAAEWKRITDVDEDEAATR